MGFSFDRWHSYAPMFIVFEIALLLACIIFLFLGPYQFPAEEQMTGGDERGTLSELSSPTVGDAAKP
jgi:hypothetical protein